VEVSPPGWVLTTVAVGSAALGVMLKHALEIAQPSLPVEFLKEAALTLVGSKGIGAMILAIIAFNLFEHFDLSRDVKIKVNWRGALLIGVLCGMFAERFMLALKALVGA
jgi:hypothetical protein